jgi:Protein of unknown function (DUF3071)
MDDLALVGVHDDGDHLLLAGPNGQKFRLRVDDSLRAAVRSDRVRLSQLQLESEGRLRPKEIQARIRAGETAEQVAAAAGVTLAHVQRYEGPVLAEREYVAEQARGVSVRRHGNSDESLGALVSDRLTQRQVDPSDVTWDAWRTEDGSWTITLDFVAGEKSRRARWSFNPALRHVTAQDDEARWLTEDEPEAASAPATSGAGPRRLTPVRETPNREHVFDVEASGAVRAVAQDPPAVDLLDTLRERRGRRSRPLTEEEERAGAPDPVREAIDSLLSRAEALGEPPPAHPARSRPHDARDGEVLVLPDVGQLDLDVAELQPALDRAGHSVSDADHGEPDDDGSGPAGRRSGNRKQRRASVPSWDDIVFGQRRD